MHIGKQVKILNTAIERQFNRQLAQFGLTGSQMSTLRFLARHTEGSIFPKDLEEEFGLSHPTVSSILRRLERDGWIVTAPWPEDKRYKTIVLTEKSQNVFASSARYVDELEATISMGLSEQELSLFFTVTDRMLRNLCQ